jgi:hypothetical protein
MAGDDIGRTQAAGDHSGVVIEAAVSQRAGGAVIGIRCGNHLPDE